MIWNYIGLYNAVKKSLRTEAWLTEILTYHFNYCTTSNCVVSELPYTYNEFISKLWGQWEGFSQSEWALDCFHSSSGAVLQLWPAAGSQWGSMGCSLYEARSTCCSVGSYMDCTIRSALAVPTDCRELLLCIWSTSFPWSALTLGSAGFFLIFSLLFLNCCDTAFLPLSIYSSRAQPMLLDQHHHGSATASSWSLLVPAGTGSDLTWKLLGSAHRGHSCSPYPWPPAKKTLLYKCNTEVLGARFQPSASQGNIFVMRKRDVGVIIDIWKGYLNLFFPKVQKRHDWDTDK